MQVAFIMSGCYHSVLRLNDQGLEISVRPLRESSIYYPSRDIYHLSFQYPIMIYSIIDKRIDVQAERNQLLHEQGYMFKPAEFISWHEETKKAYVAVINKLESLHVEALSR